MWAEIQEQLNQHGTLTGKVLAFITGMLFVIAETMPTYMAFAQILAWLGTFIAGICTGLFYLHRIYLNHKNKNTNDKNN